MDDGDDLRDPIRGGGFAIVYLASVRGIPRKLRGGAP